VHRTIKKVSEDIEEMKFNTAIASLMSLVNRFYEHEPSRGDLKALLLLLSPFAPHIAEELWEIQGFGGLACQQAWPTYDEAKTADEEKTIAVQINGKLRGTVTVPADSPDEAVKEAALASGKIQATSREWSLSRPLS
jgi:leucyl-tRNA synthetase